MTRLVTILLILLLTQSDWLKEISSKVALIDKKSSLVNTVVEKDKGGEGVLKTYSFKQYEKWQLKYKFGQFMDGEVNYYIENGVPFAQSEFGKDVLIYKGMRQPEEPYATFRETRTYFKSDTFGLKKSRKIKVYEGDRDELLKVELGKQPFKIDTLTALDFQEFKAKWSKIKNN